MLIIEVGVVAMRISRAGHAMRRECKRPRERTKRETRRLFYTHPDRSARHNALNWSPDRTCASANVIVGSMKKRCETTKYIIINPNRSEL